MCVATLCGLIQFAVIFATILRRRHQQDAHMIGDHVLSLLVVHALLGMTSDAQRHQTFETVAEADTVSETETVAETEIVASSWKSRPKFWP